MTFVEALAAMGIHPAYVSSGRTKLSRAQLCELYPDEATYSADGKPLFSRVPDQFDQGTWRVMHWLELRMGGERCAS